MEADPLIDEIRRVRHEISAVHGHDIKKYLEHLRVLHEELIRTGRFREAPRRSPIHASSSAERSP